MRTPKEAIKHTVQQAHKGLWADRQGEYIRCLNELAAAATRHAAERVAHAPKPDPKRYVPIDIGM